MTPLFIPILVSLPFLVESAGELEFDLRSIVDWGDRCLATFNATKTKLFSFNRHRDPLLVPVEMNDIELPKETSFRLLDLTFTRSAKAEMGNQHSMIWTFCWFASPITQEGCC